MQIRPLTTLEEFAEAVELQRTVWGMHDIDLLPVRFFVVASNIGGQVLGAFDKDHLVGFLLAIPGVHQNRVYMHSHMLGVLPEYRNTGAGRALKLAQKDEALARGITLVEWSFDPLDLKNAYFNIEKLGVYVREYKFNMYGYTTSSLQAGLPTDRLIAEWDLTRSRTHTTPHARVPVPADIVEIKRTNPDRAREIQSNLASELQSCFAKGFAVTGFERSPDAGTYLLTPWPSN